MIYISELYETKWEEMYPEYPCPDIEITKTMVLFIRINYRRKKIMPKEKNSLWDTYLAIVQRG